ncbi:MAG TPA: HNH endonuclease [Candidatus Limnocylindria bacterium]|nr:HNH endonuclease [Candidatus Limnocylindria bacterium]
MADTQKQRKHDYYIAHKAAWQTVYSAAAKARLAADPALAERRRAQLRDSNRRRGAYHRSYNVAYYAAHAEELRAKRRAKYAENIEASRAYNKALYDKNPERARANSRKYTAEHPDRQRKWTLDHPGFNTAMANRRRALRVGNGGSHTEQEWQEKLDLFAHCCAYCGESRPLTRDHKMPLSRGGTDDIMNIIPACRSCNSRKRTMTATEFIAARAA